MGIEDMPLIKALNEFAESLSPEHRSVLYNFAEAFLCVGAMNGALECNQVDSHQRELVDYLLRKRIEYREFNFN